MINFIHDGRYVFNPFLGVRGSEVTLDPVQDYGFSVWKMGKEVECLGKQLDSGLVIFVSSIEGTELPKHNGANEIALENFNGRTLIRHALPSANRVEEIFRMRFRAYWGESFGKADSKEVGAEFFYKSNGYGDLDRHLIESLEIGEEWCCPDFMDHKVIRFA
jgi:hypothetical protein